MNPFDPDDYPLLPTFRRLLRPVVGRAAAGAPRPRLRARLHGDLARDPGRSCSARSTTRSCPSDTDRAVALPGCAILVLALLALRHQLHPPLRDRARSASASRRGCASCSTTPTCASRARSTTGTPTGQVLSRATNDLYPIRYFIGWGVVQGDPERDDDRRRGHRARAREPAAGALRGRRDAADRAARLALRAPRDRRSRARCRQRKGDVTEAADEAVVGIEMVQAFGREDDVRERFGEQGRGGARHRCCEQAGVEAHAPAGALLPADALDRRRGLLRRPRRHRRRPHDRPVRPLQHAAPAARRGRSRRSAGSLNLAQRALASAGRSFAWLEGIEPLPEPAQPRPLPAGPLAVALRGRRASPTRGEDEVLTRRRPRVEPGEIVAVCGATGAGQDARS